MLTIDSYQHPISSKANSEPFSQETEAYRFDLYDKYLEMLTKHLNIIHGEVHDRKYWELIVGPWLLYFLYYTHYRYSSLCNRHVNIPKCDDVLIPYDYLSFNYMFEKTNYVAQVDAFLLNGAGDCSVNMKFIRYEPIQWKTWKKSLLKYIAFMFQHVRRYFKILVVSPLVVSSTYVSMLVQLKMLFLSKLRVFPTTFYWSSPNIRPVDKNMRGWKCVNTERDEFDKRFYELVLSQMPYIYLEGYKEMKQRVSHQSGKTDVVYSSTGWTQNEPFKIFGASARENGAKLIGNQHGGLSGIGKSKLIDYEENVLDKFLTWGWSNGSKKVYPFFSIKLMETRSRFDKLKSKVLDNKNILYVGTTVSRYQPDGFGLPSGEQFKDYLNWQVLFLKMLNEHCLNDLVVRLYPGDWFYGWNQQERITSKKINVRFENSNSFCEALVNAKLVVSDNNFTTVLESYACDVPTVLFFDKNLWPIREEAFSLFDRMEKVGLYHSTPKSAAEHVNEVGANPDGWWNLEKVVALRNEFKEKYARCCSDSVAKLVDFLIVSAS